MAKRRRDIGTNSSNRPAISILLTAGCDKRDGGGWRDATPAAFFFCRTSMVH
jgi:hypothetical protein